MAAETSHSPSGAAATGAAGASSGAASAPGAAGAAPDAANVAAAGAPLDASAPPTLPAVSTLEPPPPKPRAYAVGARVSALATFDQTYHAADVVDVRRPAGVPDDEIDPATMSYYVRYVGFDKRLDEWLSGTKLEPPSEGDDAGDLGAGVVGIDDVANTLANTPSGTPRAGSGGALDGAGSGRKLTRNLKRRYNEINNVAGAVEDLTPLDQKLEHEHDERTKVKNVGIVECGAYEVDAWYFSPYPVVPRGENVERLYVCHRCLKYVRKRKSYAKHSAACKASNPPGKKIYAHDRSAEGKPEIAFWEIDGARSKVYCQNLCLFAKLFLDHKTLYFDVDPFLFYVMTERDATLDAHVPVGYFSKEKFSQEEYNLACILTLPPYQRRGYGSLLIAMSYELSRREGKFGTPERPLSDLGQVSYRSFWCKAVLRVLKQHKGSISVKDIANATHFREQDIASALTSLNLLKYWKGQHIISATPKIIDEHMRSFESKHAQIEINPEWIAWTPPVFEKPAGNRRGGANAAGRG